MWDVELSMLFKCSLQVLCRRLSRFNHSAESFTQPFYSCLKPVLLLRRTGMKKAKILLSFSHVIRTSKSYYAYHVTASRAYSSPWNSIPSPIPFPQIHHHQFHFWSPLISKSTAPIPSSPIPRPPPGKSTDLNPSPPIPLFIRTPINLIPYHQFHFLPAILPSKSHRLNSGPIQFHF